MLKPGAVVICSFPGAQQTKVRPALVVSSDIYHFVRPDVVVGVLTSNTLSANLPTDFVLQDWQAASLHQATAFRSFIRTLPKTDVLKIVGNVSDSDWLEIQARLRVALAVT